METCPLCSLPVSPDMFACPRDGTLLFPEEALGLRSVSFSTADGKTIEEIVRDAPDLVPGARIGDYLIDATLGEGGMGTVYAATHATVGTKVALKVIHRALAQNPTALQRFREEARAVSSVLHRGVVDVLDLFTLPDGRPCLVLELLEGQSLSARLREGQLELAERLRIGIEVCEILEAAHSQGVVHRDLKPDNLFLAREGDSVHVKLLDFGIAKVLDETSSQPHTKTGMVVGTPAYMAPEQIRGDVVDARSDVYALGVLFYRLFCGRPPFLSTNMVDLFLHHLQRQPPPPETLSATVPPLLSPVMQQMLAKNPDNRPSLVRVRATLLAVLEPNSKIGQALRTTTGGAPAPARRSGRTIATALRKPLAQPVRQRTVALVVAGALVVAVGATVMAGRSPDTPEEGAVTTDVGPLTTPVVPPPAPVEESDAPDEAPPPEDGAPLPDPPRVVLQIEPLNVRSKVCVGSSCANAEGSYVLPVVPNRKTKVSVTAPGYFGYEATVTLADGERREVRVSLEPLKATKKPPPRKRR